MRVAAILLTAALVFSGQLSTARADHDWRDDLRDQHKLQEKQLEAAYKRQRDELKLSYELQDDQLKYERDRGRRLKRPARKWHEREYDRRRDHLEDVYDRQRDQLKLDYKTERDRLEDEYEWAKDHPYHHVGHVDFRQPLPVPSVDPPPRAVRPRWLPYEHDTFFGWGF
ncbi:MAG: hypothetical protein WD278_08070 [Pirellulales bacterium]